MTNLKTVSRLTCLTIVLAAGTMMATANIANAKGNQHQDHKAQNNGHQRGAMSGRPAGVKTALREQKKCRKHCEKPTQTSTDKKPATTSSKPAVSEQPANAKAAASSPPTTATLSNGVNTSAIFNGKDGLTVTAASPTSITVTNSSHSSVTMGGQSITLSGATSVKAGPGMEVRRLANGDVTIAIAPTRPTPPALGPAISQRVQPRLRAPPPMLSAPAPSSLVRRQASPPPERSPRRLRESPSKAPSRSPATLPILPGPPLSGWPTGSSGLP